ncbi:LysR family transcriptional regulator [Halomonas elongata]|uniref:LysR family transcriptional regulator n=1 Tax=Halomonas elongata TaxID=2746 RepID=UPI003344E768
MNLNYLRVFIEIARRGSLLEASTSLSIPNSTVGRHLAELEKELGMSLVIRNTRHLSLTEDGKELFERASHLIDNISEIENDILYQNNGLTGKIKIAIPNEFSAQWLSECLARFASHNPGISIDCSTSMVSVDPIQKDVDVSIIYLRGKPDDSSLVMQNLMAIPSVIVGSPNLIKQHGMPKSVSEMAKAPCISTLHALRSNPWHFIDHDEKWYTQNINCRYRVDSSSMLISAAVEGVGFAIIPIPFCKDLIEQGALTKLELDMKPAPLQVAAVFPNRKISTRTRSLVDEIRKTLHLKINQNSPETHSLII